MGNQENHQPAAGKQRFYYGYIVVIASFFIMMFSYGVYHSFGIFFKPILYEFGWTRTITSGPFSFSWVIHSVASLFMGYLYDKFGPRMVITLCGLLVGIGYLLMSQVSDIWHLYLIYGILIGTGSATFTPITSAVAKLFIKRRTVMTGISTIGIGFGSLVIPIVANKIISLYDWRVSFIMLGALGLVVMISGAQFLKQDVQGSEQLDRSNNKTNTSQIRSEGFSFIEAIATKQFWMIFAMVFCFGFCVFVIQVHIVPYTTDMQISAATAALILSTIGGSSIIGRIVLGSLGDKIGNRNAYIIVFLPMAISILLLIPSREPWNFFLLAFIFGLAYGNGVAQESPLVAAMFGLSSLGSILGLIVFAFGIGVAIGPVLASYMFDVTGSYQLALIVTAAVSVIALILTILLKPVKAKIQAN